VESTHADKRLRGSGLTTCRFLPWPRWQGEGCCQRSSDKLWCLIGIYSRCGTWK